MANKVNNKNSKINFLLLPPSTENYYFDMLDSLSDALKKMGHFAYVLKNNVDCQFLSKLIRNLDIDVVFQINALLNPNLDLPSKTIFLSWFQDIFPGDENIINKTIVSNNYILTLGCPEIVGLTKKPKNYLGSFFSGVSTYTLDSYDETVLQDTDVNICGFIPYVPYQKKIGRLNLRKIQSIPFPVNTIFKLLLNGSVLDQRYFIGEMSEIVRSIYSPLTGSLDVFNLEKTLRSQLGISAIDFHKLSNEKAIFPIKADNLFKACLNLELYLQDRAVRFYSQIYPRYLDREKLFNLGESISYNFKVYGKNWDKYEKYKPNSGGHIDSKSNLLNVYRKSKINLVNNTHGLGLHSRVFESMACGGFIATHSSKRDRLQGGILSSFEEGEHFVYFEDINKDDLLRDNEYRKRISRNAYMVVRDNHTWDNRAKQLVDIVSNKLDFK